MRFDGFQWMIITDQRKYSSLLEIIVLACYYISFRFYFYTVQQNYGTRNLD